MRSLTAEEKALWSRVASTIRPLSRDPKDVEQVRPLEVRAVGQVARAPATRGAIPSPANRKRAPGTTLDGSWDGKLRSGSVEPDRIVDLHGLSLDRAWQTIDRALDQSIARGERLLLLITGHQRGGEPPIERGAIRSAVHDWLAASRLSGAIAAVRGAHRRHGGGGSLYIILRRSR